MVLEYLLENLKGFSLLLCMENGMEIKENNNGKSDINKLFAIFVHIKLLGVAPGECVMRWKIYMLLFKWWLDGDNVLEPWH